ncbi:MAG: 5-carboxymethyl-2-hydroxymuconate Delta-isomerase [Alphaproteobacteria bacterium]
MPHLVVHHSGSVQVSALLADVHHALCHQPTIDPNAVKTRALSFETAYVGQGKNPFLHLEIRLLQGRSPETLSIIQKALIQACRPHLNPSVVLTSEIVLMDPVLYFKE